MKGYGACRTGSWDDPIKRRLRHKEEAALFSSAGASPEDAADLLGIAATAFTLALLRRRRHERKRARTRTHADSAVSIV
jgi:hypothetical protein